MSDPSNESGQPHGEAGSETPATPTVEELQAKLDDLTKHSRKWEDRAKENKAAKDELERQARERMTEDERRSADFESLQTRAAEAETRAATAEAALERYKVAVEFSLSAEDAAALESVTDPDALRALAERLSGRSSAPKPHPSQGQRAGATPPTSHGDIFAELVGDFL